ncbi:penicillin-binding protein 1C [Cohaesibacter intestini]|uniref:penicillin-binding protein 1C n=1 Tax=Cohaesibacter intestini TaxID=2211145 RepID=UPI001FE1DFA9|nr:penicillin-binding protein 1C [Cohaesibacter intestini]
MAPLRSILTKIPMPKLFIGMGLGIGFFLMLFVGGWIGFVQFDKTNPPPLSPLTKLSVEVVDREGTLLRAYVTPTGHWRLKADLGQIDPEFIKILLAYEDKRFFAHHGIDPEAMLRASWQLLTNGRIISGASTITMQLARLLEPRENRTIGAKLWQMLRAIQLERRMSKPEILAAYLTLAPYGGNIEGVRAATLAYFGKEPGALSLSEAALLVALPQSPVARRPDIHPERALKARNTVLERMAKAAVIDIGEVARATAQPLRGTRQDLPQLAAHAADRLIRAAPEKAIHHTLLRKDSQQQLETVVKRAAGRLGPTLSVALVMADAKTGDILVEIGSPDYVSAARAGWIDMSRALRSPGSALKPFIYGLAFEEGLVRDQTLIDDRPVNFGGYRPKNFNMDYQGEVTIREALLQSLNVPVVALLDAIGPQRLMGRIRQGGVKAELPEGETIGLAVGLGGMGLSLKDLTQLYTLFANDGRVRPLRLQAKDTVPSELTEASPEASGASVLDPIATWHIANILKDASPPRGSAKLAIAYKTGTSYSYRDAWSVGFDGRHVIGVWVGKADNGAVPGITGWSAAAPILFEAFAKSGLALEPLPSAPLGALDQARADLPPTMKRFHIESRWDQDAALPEPPPRISYPPSGAQIELAQTSDMSPFPVVIKLQDGRPPFRWLANGQVFDANGNRRQIHWTPDGAGQSTLTVIDAAGRADSVSLFLRLP